MCSWIEEVPDSKSIMSESRVCRFGIWCDPTKTWWTGLKKSSRLSWHRGTERLRLSQEVIDVVRTRRSNICKHYTSNTAKSCVKWLRRKQRLRWKLWEQVCDGPQHHHKQQLERHAQQAAHNAQQVHQWRRWLRRLRGVHRALSLHIERTLPHLTMTPHTSCLKFWAITLSTPCHPWRVLFDSISHFFLLLVLPALLRLLPLSRAVPWARQPDRRASLRYSASHESEDTLNFHFSHRLWAQPPDFRQAQRLISPLLLHDPFHGPRRGWGDSRLDAHSGTPRTSRILRTRRHVSQSVSRRLKFSMDQGNLMQREWSITQENLVLPETRTVLTACILKTSKLREWSINQGNLMSETAQTHR